MKDDVKVNGGRVGMLEIRKASLRSRKKLSLENSHGCNFLQFNFKIGVSFLRQTLSEMETERE